jgi:ParB/RepB/Spo0J family partition protein
VPEALVDLELRFLARPYEDLRLRVAEREREVAASLDKHGQQHPILVVAGPGEQFTVVDGHVRVRALRRLGRDVVRAQVLAGPIVDALVHVQIGLSRRRPVPLEEAWLIRELMDNQRRSIREVAARFSRTTAWVQGRLDLLKDLPAEIQDLVAAGRLGAHVAERVLLPMARMNRIHAQTVAAALVSADATSREAQELLAHYRKGKPQARQVLVSNALTFLKALRVPADVLLGDRPLTGDDRSLVERLTRLARAAEACARELASRSPDTCSDTFKAALTEGLKAATTAMARLTRAITTIKEEPQGGSHDFSGDAPHGTPAGAEESRDPGDRPDSQSAAQHGAAPSQGQSGCDALPGPTVVARRAHGADRSADPELPREHRARGRGVGEDRREAGGLLDAHPVLPRPRSDAALEPERAGG